MYKRIQYLFSPQETNPTALAFALKFTQAYQASLQVLAVLPALPDSLSHYLPSIEQGAKEHINHLLNEAAKSALITLTDIDINITVEINDHPFIEAIRQSFVQDTDLIIKRVETKAGHLSAGDLSLVRKSPIAVLLLNGSSHLTSNTTTATALKVNIEDAECDGVANKLLATTQHLSQTLGITPRILSCYSSEAVKLLDALSLERLAPDELKSANKSMLDAHYHALEKIVESANLPGAHIKQLNGDPTTSIPDYLIKNTIDILIIATDSSAILPGLLIGRTAESIINRTTCAILAIKPEGFISPIKPDL